ncbi:MAG: hypothetical protein KKD86_06790 [Bacteroidetes bacterium]|nr:hypothetical protein [Bacteroidota bacterium]
MTSIIQPEFFYLTIKVNGIIYPNINKKTFEYYSNSGWKRIKPIDNLFIENSWLVQNNFYGQLSIELILDSRMWGKTVANSANSTLHDEYGFYTIDNSDFRNVVINNNPTPTTPSISMSGGYGYNPTLTFSGGGPNIDHYVLKKEYDFGSGFYPHYVNPVSSTFTDPNVEITKFGGDLVARYSVKAVGPTGIESNFSNTVSTNGQSLWKNNDGEGGNNQNNNEFGLKS